MNNFAKSIDWFSILLYACLVFIGWINIYSTTYSSDHLGLMNLDTFHGKQLMFIIVSFIAIIITLAIETKFYERFSSVIFMVAIVSLAGLYLFGKNINGATSWYAIGGMTLQPSEFAKAATALALANYISDIQTDLNNFKDLLKAFAIICIPALLIIPQPDPGSALIYLAFFFVLYREGLSATYLLVGIFAIVIFIATLLFGTLWVALITIAILIIAYLIYKRKKKKISVFKLIAITLITIALSYSVSFIFNHVFEQRHRDRFSLWLRLEDDPSKLDHIRKTIGYNTYQSESAIGSGGFNGKGFLEGTRTKGNFVPEQHTDYIFSTVGEEWGFLGSGLVVLLFAALVLRIIFMAERQKSAFSRIYGYAVASILFFHFAINIGMVIGLLPTIGIPLPFFSYGGSGLLGFTILLFIFIKLDANRINEW